MKPNMIYKCQNCGKVYKKVDDLSRFTDANLRVGPGDVMPHGECSGCGCAVLAEPEVLRKPLSMTAMKKLAKKDNWWICGTVQVDLSEIVGLDLEGFLDLISQRLTGTDILENQSYEIVGHIKDSLLLFIEGDARAILKTEEN